MKILLKCLGASALVYSGAALYSAQPSNELSLLVVGPVDSKNAKEQTAIVLGQKIPLSAIGHMNVGETAAVFGKVATNGTLVTSVIRDQGRYVAGATSVLLTGVLEKNDLLTGRAVIGGVTVDVTPTMADGPFSAAVGSTIQVVGIQPNAGGVILASGISGSGKIAPDGISGSGKATPLGISGSGKVAPDGISGSGKATPLGISGSGKVAPAGISGSGKAAPLGISGSGKVAPAGISGSG